MNKLYRGLENKYLNIPEGEKVFWHESIDQYTPKWKVRKIEDGNIIHYSSDFFDPINLGKFKHILSTDNESFEFRIFEKGILRVNRA
jgi:hypothetical protein